MNSSDTAHRRDARHTIMLGDPLVLRPVRLADRLFARAHGASLDQHLAAGCPPESSRLLAARAQDIVALQHRESVAGSWRHLLRVARRSPAGRTPVPLNVGAILAAEPAITELIARLIAPLPVTAQGVAAATVPLTNATSPVYDRLRPEPLAGLLDHAIDLLDPARPLMGAAHEMAEEWLDGGMTSQGTETRVLSASREIAAGAGTIFELIADPALQPSWDGNDNLKSAAAGQRVRGVGDVFAMTLTKTSGVRDNRVTEFEEGRLIAWMPGDAGQEPAGHLWRWTLEPVGDARTLVTQTYDWTGLSPEAPAPRLERARSMTTDNLRASLDRLAALAEAS